MSFTPAVRVGVWFLILVEAVVSQAAQPKASPAGHNVVDIVSLKSGRSLRGGIAGQDPHGKLLMAVSLDWYREAYPAKLADLLTENIEMRKAAWTQVRERISERLKAKTDSPQFELFLKNEQERLDQALAERNPADPDFLWIEISPQTISKIVKATSEQRQIALQAWDQRLAKVETRDAASLKKELLQKAVNLEGPPPDLSDRFVARPQEGREWAARMALIEYTLSKSLDFQGIGETLTRTDEGQAVNLTEILPMILQQQLGALLKDLTDDNRLNVKAAGNLEWLRPAIREAESSKCRGFRVSRVAIDSVAFRVSVESQFVALVSPGVWQTVWRSTVTEDGTKARPAAEARIEQDPQVKSAIDAMKAIGVLDPNSLQQAIRVGAATMAAQQNAERLFVEYRDQYTRRLDGPPLQIAVGE